jgi:hypothetical protein
MRENNPVSYQAPHKRVFYPQQEGIYQQQAPKPSILKLGESV